MIIVGSNRKTRKAYAEPLGDGSFIISPFDQARGSHRPFARFDSREELEAYAESRRHEVIWLEPEAVDG